MPSRNRSVTWTKWRLASVARSLRMAPSKVYGVATFYNFFTLKPQGAHTCVVCLGTACYVKGAAKVLAAIEGCAHIKAGETTADKQFSLLTARCVGACAIAPIGNLRWQRLRPDDRRTGSRTGERIYQPWCLKTLMGSRRRKKRAASRSACGAARRAGACPRGALEIKKALEKTVADKDLAGRVEVRPVGCMGACGHGPLVSVEPQGLLYEQVTPENAPSIIDAIDGGIGGSAGSSTGNILFSRASFRSCSPMAAASTRSASKITSRRAATGRSIAS